MLKRKEFVSDLRMQYEISKNVHAEEHAGISKCTAIVSSKFHWVRIKETVNLAIKNCSVCSKQMAREKDPPPAAHDGNPRRQPDASLDEVTENLAATTGIPVPAGEGHFGYPLNSEFEGSSSGVTLDEQIRCEHYPSDQSIYRQQQQHEFNLDYPVDPRITENTSNSSNEVNSYLNTGEYIQEGVEHQINNDFVI